MVNAWLQDCFFPAIEEMGIRNSIVVCDNARVHNEEEISDLFEEVCPETCGQVIMQPKYAAKYISPLDNGAHSAMEHKFRSKLHKTDFSVNSMLECINECYYEMDGEQFQNFYRNCNLGNLLKPLEYV